MGSHFVLDVFPWFSMIYTMGYMHKQKGSQNLKMRQFYFTLTLFFALVALPLNAHAEKPESEKTPTPTASLKAAPYVDKKTAVYEYYVLRNGSQIGFYRFAVSAPLGAEGEKNPDDLLEIKTQMGIKVKLLFVTAYQADYSATSAYDGNTLVRHESLANYNGDNYLVNYDRAQNPDHLVVNAQGRKLSYGPMTLHPYYVDGENRMTLVTEKGKLRDIVYRTLGNKRLKIGTNYYNSTHARIEGDVTRDLWYDMDGILMKVAYEKDGATISLVRKGIENQ